jgi:phage FluMu protein Com
MNQKSSLREDPQSVSGVLTGNTIDQAINGGFPWLEIQCSRCKTPNDVDLAALKHPPTTFVHDLASRLRCRKCAKAGRRPSATLLQLGWQPRHPRAEV